METVFTYSYVKQFFNQSEHAYYPNCFIKWFGHAVYVEYTFIHNCELAIFTLVDAIQHKIYCSNNLERK